MSTKEIDWNLWKPADKAVLCFILKRDKILLIRKKRGLGAGKINGPGGRIEAGEECMDAAIRETQEEVGVTPHHLDLRGELHFQFRDGYSLHCNVFTASDYSGELCETDEATPLWSDLDKIPFLEMWSDDAHWLPGMLAGGKFRGYFHFESDKMLAHQVIWASSPKNILFCNILNINCLYKI